jgi:hypothetical protein
MTDFLLGFLGAVIIALCIAFFAIGVSLCVVAILLSFSPRKASKKSNTPPGKAPQHVGRHISDNNQDGASHRGHRRRDHLVYMAHQGNRTKRRASNDQKGA